MSAIPAFKIGLWNAWIFIVPYLLVNFGLPFLFVGKKSSFWNWPSYTKLERMYLLTAMLFMICMAFYSIFLPLNVGTTWFYAGLPVYLLGLAFIITAMLAFIALPADKPNTTGLYRISRHPMYLGIFLMYIGIGIASASWVYLLLALLYLATYRNAYMIPEERFCCEKFGDVYRKYINSTPRWLGMPKSLLNIRSKE
jgi:protein-S-isoprenylcysteine O-methyltransferase Ste14